MFVIVPLLRYTDAIPGTPLFAMILYTSLTSCASLRSFSIFFNTERCFSSYWEEALDGDIMADLRSMLFDVVEPLRATWLNCAFNSVTCRVEYMTNIQSLKIAEENVALFVMTSANN